MRKLSIILNIYIAVGLVVLVFLVAQYATRTQAPTDSSASGFGAEATRDLYEPTAEILLNTPCETIFYDDYLANANFPALKGSSFVLSTSQPEPLDNMPLDCIYDLGGGKSVELQVFTYHIDSVIDDTRTQLFERINSPMIEGGGVDNDVVGIMDYFMGVDKTKVGSCRTNLYHPLNDFEYATLTYKGFDCNKLLNVNREFVTIFGNYLVQTLEYIYSNYGHTTTADLLYTWGFESRIVDLNFYSL